MSSLGDNKKESDESIAYVKGVAPIKKEFLLPTVEKTVNWDHVPDQTKKVDHDIPCGEKRERLDDRDANPNKRFKLRGQNKNKLRYQIGKRVAWGRKGGPNNRNDERMKKELDENEDNNVNEKYNSKDDKTSKLCLKLLETNGMCPYGKDKCNYSHDLYTIYQAMKEESCQDDLKPCYLYSTYGRCSYGIACKFSKDHTFVNEEKKLCFNKIDHRKWSFGNGRNAYKNKYSNKLEQSVQHDLRKKRYNFKIVDEAIKTIYAAEIDEGYNDEKEEIHELESGKKRIGCALVDEFVKSRDIVKKKVDFKNKLFLAPLTTVGNLPFRRLCKKFSCDITCAEMSLSASLLNGNPSEWSHLKRHETEDVFGIQITGHHVEPTSKVVKLLNDTCDVDFIDLNCGCPTEWIYQTGAGAGLMQRPSKLRKIIAGACMVSRVPITVKMRTGCTEGKNNAHCIINSIVKPFGSEHIGAITVHGRYRNQRYLKSADWDYIEKCSNCSDDIPVYGSGDCIAWETYEENFKKYTGLSGVMIARGALLKPWIFTEIREKRTWDISSKERLDIIGEYVKFALDHWGSDSMGVESSRKFLLEWLSFACRYIPAGLLEVLPQKMNDRPPSFKGRDDLETLLSSSSCSDWIKISEMFLGRVPDNFTFYPKHKANAYESLVEG